MFRIVELSTNPKRKLQQKLYTSILNYHKTISEYEYIFSVYNSRTLYPKRKFNNHVFKTMISLHTYTPTKMICTNLTT